MNGPWDKVRITPYLITIIPHYIIHYIWLRAVLTDSYVKTYKKEDISNLDLKMVSILLLHELLCAARVSVSQFYTVKIASRASTGQ